MKVVSRPALVLTGASLIAQLQCAQKAYVESLITFRQSVSLRERDGMESGGYNTRFVLLGGQSSSGTLQLIAR
jgi:hypothetical protein